MVKLIRNPLYTGLATFAILVIVVAWMWDSYRNKNKDFYGMIKPEATTTTAV